MAPPHAHGPEDSQERRRRHFDDYYPSLQERVTILEQKHKLQIEAIRNEMENIEAALKERISELLKANETLQATAATLRLQVSELKIRSGIIGTLAGLVTMVGFFLLEKLFNK